MQTESDQTPDGVDADHIKEHLYRGFFVERADIPDRWQVYDRLPPGSRRFLQRLPYDLPAPFYEDALVWLGGDEMRAAKLTIEALRRILRESPIGGFRGNASAASASSRDALPARPTPRWFSPASR